MNNEDINKYLTEAMGERTSGLWAEENDFFTWEGFGKLREFYDTWEEEKRVAFWQYADFHIKENDWLIDAIWHKDNTANLIYGFLKEYKDES